jgi:hypothetical protein
MSKAQSAVATGVAVSALQLPAAGDAASPCVIWPAKPVIARRANLTQTDQERLQLTEAVRSPLSEAVVDRSSLRDRQDRDPYTHPHSTFPVSRTMRKRDVTSMRETTNLRWIGCSWWVVGLSMVANLTTACSDDKGQTGNQVVAGNTALAGSTAAPAGSSALGGSGGSTAPKPGMIAMLAGTNAQTAGMPPSAAGAGGIIGSGSVAGASGALSAIAGSSGAQAGATAQAGAGGAAGAAGQAGAAGSTAMPGMGFTSVCAGGMLGKDSMSSGSGGGGVSEYAAVKYLARGNQILSLKTTMLVPKKPTAMQTLFIWPGLQCNGGKDPARIGNGILQPVLTWGGSCAPKRPSSVYADWWMSGMYVNVSTSAAGPTGCAGGDYMSTAVGDQLQIDMSVKGTAWTQTILDLQTMKKVDFTIDLKGQDQNWATWAIEVPRGETIVPADEQVFTDNVLTFAAPVTSCQPSQHGPMDYFSTPILSTDKLNCCYEKIVLRARGTPSTTM